MIRFRRDCALVAGPRFPAPTFGQWCRLEHYHAELAGDLGRAVGGVVIHHENLGRLNRLLLDGLKQNGKVTFFVAGRNDDRKATRHELQ